MLSEQFVTQMKQRLEEEKQRLEKELLGLSEHTEVGTTPDENAEEVELDEVSKTLINRIKSDLEKINKALSKIQEGTYGLDDEGREISEERLKVLPWADKAL